jgi:nucleotide-binding universal stress UspA family protein
MYHRVVIPLDGSELAEDVLPHVAELIRGRDSQVFLLSVTPVMKGAIPPFVDLRPKRDDQQRVAQELEGYLRTVAGPLAPVAADIQVNVRFGRPADEILTFVGEVDADLIAMSTHGRSGLGHWVFGTVTDRVLRGTECPVLLVQAEHTQPHASYQRVVVPLDGSELAEQVLPYVQALVCAPQTAPLQGAFSGNPHVFLISVLATGLGERTVALLTSYPPGLQLTTTALDRAEVQLRGYLRSVATALRSQGIAAQIAVRRGVPADEILSYAVEVEADAIAMTTHGLSGMSRWVYGDVAGKVLQGAHSPVLLVRPTFGEEKDKI